MPNWKKVIVSGSDASLNSLNVTAGVTGSLLGTASFASTASFVNPLNQNVLITGSASNSLRVKGSGATSATNTLYLENSSNINTFAVADNGNVTVNTGSLTVNQATGAGTGITLKAPTDYYSPKLEFNAIGGTSHIIQAYGGPLFLNGGNYNVCFGVYNAAGTVSNVNIYTYPYGGSQPAYPNNYSMLIKNPDTTGVNLMVRAASGQAGIGSITEWQNSGGTEVVAKITASGSAYFKSDITASSFSGSHIGPLTGTASYASLALTASYVAIAQTASYVLQAVSSSFASTASYVNPLNQNVLITGSASNSLRVKGSGATSATNALLIENSGNTGSLVVRDDARVGINTTTPNTTLDVNGNTLITGSLRVADPNGFGGITIPIVAPTNYYPTLTIANTTLQGYQTSGNVFTISNTGYTIEFGSNRGYMIFVSAGHHYFQSGGSNTRMFISSSGRIGIAKSSSLNATLDIIGSQVITGSLEVSAGITGSFLGTASYATQALTASFYGGSVTSASFASTASYVNPLNQNVTITGASSNSLRVKGSGTTSATNAVLVENSAGTSILNIADNGDSTITGSLAISTLGATLLSLGPSGSEYMVARASGYIGINNTTPTGFLHIRSSQNNGSTWVLLAQNSTAALPGNNNGGTGTILAIRDDYKVSITGSTNISGSLIVTGSADFSGGITGSFLGTASYASMALTASYALSSAGGGGGGSTFPYTGSAIISGSLVVTGSFAVITGSTVEFQVLPTGVKIGEISTDVHTVTGSLNVSGSISATTLSGSDDRLLFATSAGIVSASSQTLVSAYINPAGTIAGYLNNTSSWDINGDYSGSAITGTYQGQKHYNSNYFFEAVDDNIWIRLIRG